MDRWASFLFDKASHSISYPCMPKEPNCSTARISGCLVRSATTTLTIVICLAATGCLSSLQKHSAALSAATNPVLDQANTVYHAAQAIHNERLDYEAVDQFDASQTVDPATIVAFPSDGAIQVRLTVLEAFKCYAQSLVEISSGTSSPQFAAAAKSVGGSLVGLSNTLAPTIQGALGETPASGTTTVTTITSASTTSTTSATAAAPLMSDTDGKIVSAAALALGQFLVRREVKKELPLKIKDMDPKLDALCALLESDIDYLQDHDKRDFTFIKQRQTFFIQEKTLGAQEHRVQIVKLAELIRQQQAADQGFKELRDSIVKLKLTHRALAADAQNNNPESLKAKIAELAAAGNDLGKFYSSLGTK